MKDYFNIIIAGSRDFSDYATLEKRVKEFIAHLALRHAGKQIVIISGAARGADRLGERFALNNDCRLVKMPADWDRYGKSAGYRRNEEMVKVADAAIYFWDGKSRGTAHCINSARDKGVPYAVIVDNAMNLYNMAHQASFEPFEAMEL